MKRLWAPWRVQYIQGIDSGKDEECIFCAKPKEKTDKENLILFRGTHNFIILNRYPYNNGHLMIVPYIHVSDIASVDPATFTEMWKLVAVCDKALTQAFHPEGFNIGMNVGRVAGAGIDQHLHLHIVPRWNGDTNFMPAIGFTKMISQALDETYDALKANLPV